jgi:hypothetical protein
MRARMVNGIYYAIDIKKTASKSYEILTGLTIITNEQGFYNFFKPSKH